jgi:glycosyltransferase 2 family protein
MMNPARKGGPWRTIASVVLVAAIFFFMGRSLYHNWHAVQGELANLHFRWYLLPLPFACFAGAFVVGAYAWKLILSYFGERISLQRACQIVAYSQFGKYVPGKVWVALGRMYLAREAGVAERHTALSLIIETSYLLISALGLFVFSLIFYPGLLAKTWLLLVLIPVTLVAIYPPVFNRIVNFLLARVKQRPVEFRIRLDQAAVLFAFYCVSWFGQGLGLYFLTLSFYPVKLAALLVFPGAFSLSWILGFIVIIAPGGLGVREGLFAVLIEPIVTGAMNIIVSLLSRLWISVSEILVFLFIFAFMRLRKPGDRPKDLPDREARSGPDSEPERSSAESGLQR